LYRVSEQHCPLPTGSLNEYPLDEEFMQGAASAHHLVLPHLLRHGLLGGQGGTVAGVADEDRLALALGDQLLGLQEHEGLAALAELLHHQHIRLGKDRRGSRKVHKELVRR